MSETIFEADIVHEMRDSYMEYAMSSFFITSSNVFANPNTAEVSIPLELILGFFINAKNALYIRA